MELDRRASAFHSLSTEQNLQQAERSIHQTCLATSECREGRVPKCTNKESADGQIQSCTNRRSACLSRCERCRFVGQPFRVFSLPASCRHRLLSGPVR